MLDQEIDLHLKAVEGGLVTLAQHCDLMKGLQEIGCILEGLPFVTTQLQSFELDVAVYHPRNCVAAFDCVSEKPVPGVLPGLARELQHFSRKVFELFVQCQVAHRNGQPIYLVQRTMAREAPFTDYSIFDNRARVQYPLCGHIEGFLVSTKEEGLHSNIENVTKTAQSILSRIPVDAVALRQGLLNCPA